MSTGIRLVSALINIGQDLIHFPIRATDVQYFFLYMTSMYVEYFLHSVLNLAAIVDSTLQYTERKKKKKVGQHFENKRIGKRCRIRSQIFCRVYSRFTLSVPEIHHDHHPDQEKVLSEAE